MKKFRKIKLVIMLIFTISVLNVRSFEMEKNAKVIKIKDLEIDEAEFEGEPQVTYANVVKCAYRVNVEKGLIIVLSMFITIFTLTLFSIFIARKCTK